MGQFKDFVERRKTGVYVACKFTPDSCTKMAEWCVSHLIPKPLNLNEYHATVVYSRADVPNAQEIVHKFFEKHQTDLKFKGKGFELFDSKGGPMGNDKRNVLVLELDAPKLKDLHDTFKKAGATHDYPDFRPHVTLSYDVQDGFDLKSLPIPNVTLVASDLTAEPLNANWQAK